MECEDHIEDPLKLAVDLDQKEKVRMRDIRPSDSKVTSLHRKEKLSRDVSDAMRESNSNTDEYQQVNTAVAGVDILTRYLAASVGKSKPIGRLN